LFELPAEDSVDAGEPALVLERPVVEGLAVDDRLLLELRRDAVEPAPLKRRPAPARHNTLDRLVDTLLVGHEGVAHRLVANEADDRRGDLAVREVAPGDPQRLLGVSRAVEGELELLELAPSEVAGPLRHDEKGRDVV